MATMLLVINQYRGNTSVQQTQKIRTSECMKVTHFRANNILTAFTSILWVNPTYWMSHYIITQVIRKPTVCLRIFILSTSYKFWGSESCSTRYNCSTALVTLIHTSYAPQRSLVAKNPCRRFSEFSFALLTTNPPLLHSHLSPSDSPEQTSNCHISVLKLEVSSLWPGT